MLELKNSKTTYLGKALDGRDKFALDAFIGAVQMSKDGKVWEDIKPRLVRKPTDDGYYVDRVPYYAEFNDNGSRLFCPDRYQRTEFFGLSAIPLLSNLPKNLVSSPTKLDGEILPNKIVMPAYWGEIRISFANTAMQFEVLFNEAPPSAVFGQDSPRIVFDTDLAGLEIFLLLNAKTGLGIPRPRLIDSNDEPVTRWLDWSYKDGQLELGFDLTGLKFPVLLKNTTIDEQVGQSTDDCLRYSTTINLTSTSVILGNETNSFKNGLRFQTVNISQGSTIDAAYLTFKANSGRGETVCNVDILGEDADDTNTFSTAADYDGRPRTTAKVDWDNLPSWSWNSIQNSPSIVSIVQEIVSRGGWSANNNMVFFLEDDSSTANARRRAYSYDGGASDCPKIHIEYSAGGGATPKGWWSK